MDNLWAMILLGKGEPSFWRLLAPLLTIVAIAVFGWLNEKAKQKERQQRAQDDARRQREDQGRARGAEPTRQVRPVQAQPEDIPSPRAQRQTGPRSAQPIHRYQPQIPTAGGRGAELPQPQAQEPELIVVAEDVSAEAAQSQFRREQQRLRAEAIRRARVLQAQRTREARRKAKPARPRTLDLKPLGEFPSEAAFPYTEVFQPGAALLAPGQTISPPQIRRAILWAEILGAPRALRPYSDPP